MSRDKEQPPSQRNLRIVVVDDNRDAAYTLSMLLEHSGFRVVATIYDATKAIYTIEKERPHVVITDIAMPGIDGYEIARRLKAEMQNPPRLVALTGLGTAVDKRDADAAGFDVHLTKPVEWAELEAILLAYAEQRPALEHH